MCNMCDVYVICNVCVSTVGSQRITLGSQFSLSTVGMRDQMQVRFRQQAFLPTEPSYWT